MPAVVVSVPPEALVIRFRPTTVEPVLRSATVEFRRDGHFGLSVFADVAGSGESEQDLIDRLLRVSELDGMAAAGNPKFYICGSAGNLLSEGFVFMKDGHSGEPAEHFCVNLGGLEPDPGAVERFLGQFDRTERR